MCGGSAGGSAASVVTIRRLPVSKPRPAFCTFFATKPDRAVCGLSRARSLRSSVDVAPQAELLAARRDGIVRAFGPAGDRRRSASRVRRTGRARFR
ncbi:MAG: hypothetical protein D6725_04960 [Planctomycetota bacterium]|nr:MAG: hypothetical protein D6725_04960 [Planctomycetota bacterium]